jgi:hypothetical protein
VVHALEVAGDVAAQREDAAAVESLDTPGPVAPGIKSAVLHGETNELGFKPRGGEELVDADEELALLAIFLGTEDLR